MINMKPFKPFVIHGIAKDISFEGKGVVSFTSGTLFCDSLFIDEEADIEVLYKRNGVYFGKIKKLYKLSKNRIEPKCKVCSACGGCQFQQYSYAAQLIYKQNKVKSALYRHLKKEIDVNKVIGMDNPYYYRNKIQMPIGKDKKNNIISGFYRSGTHDIIPIEKCYIEDEVSFNIIKVLKDLIKEFHYEPYDEDSGKGIFRHILIRSSKHYKEVMVTLVTNVDEFKGKNNFVKEYIKRCPNITSIIQNINTRKTNVILGEKERVLYGPAFIKDSILGINFLISSKSFFQVNPIQVEKLYQTAIEMADLKPNDRVLDAYSGIGTISLIVSKYVKEVVGIEIVKDAVKDANKNKKINNIDDVSFICGDAKEEIRKLNEDNIKFDVVFVDPPRKGLDKEFIDALLDVKPSKIIYISCEPETLARDIFLLTTKKYKINKVQPVDMFPMTYHVETVTSLILNK